MKKIYILTFFLSPNYGSKLQATALARFLERKGYKVTFIKNFLVPSYLLRHPSLLMPRIINQLHKKERLKFFNPVKYEISEKRRERLRAYDRENLTYCTLVKGKDWRRIRKEEPIFISGSDIIWQPANGIPDKYFLDFTDFTKCRRIAYASSIGAKELPESYGKYYRKYLNKYDSIAVREDHAVSLLQPFTSRKIVKVIDPTLLLPRTEWDLLAEKAVIPEGIKKGEYIVCYFVMQDQRYWKYMELIRKAAGLKIVVLPMHKEDESHGDVVIDAGTPCEFIWLIANSAFVFTDSFHAMAFSFIYEKEFYVMGRSRSAEDDKYSDFLNRYGLAGRRIENEDVFERNPDIDFTYGKEVLRQEREFAQAYLNNALGEE